MEVVPCDAKLHSKPTPVCRCVIVRRDNKTCIVNFRIKNDLGVKNLLFTLI